MHAPIDLNLARAFIAVHETESFSAAGDRLRVPRSTVSRAVATLEEALGVVLFHRTTRKVTTTAAGRSLYQRVVPSLSALETSLADASDRAESISGTIRVTTVADLGVTVLAGAVARFIAKYPDVHVDLQLSTSVLDIAKGDIDLALRVTTKKKLADSALIARKIGRIRVQLYASPAYLARRGMPRSPTELAGHEYIGIAGNMPMPQGQRRVTVDDMFTLRELLRNGAGIGALSSHLAEPDIEAGLLVGVLPQWFELTGTIFMVEPTKKHVPRRVNLLREHIVEQIRRVGLTESRPAR